MWPHLEPLFESYTSVVIEGNVSNFSAQQKEEKVTLLMALHDHLHHHHSPFNI